MRIHELLKIGQRANSSLGDKWAAPRLQGNRVKKRVTT